MPERLPLADADSVRDALTFAGRAGRVSDEGVRLQSSGGVLRMSTATLAPQGLLDATPTVIAMRVLASDPELTCDFVVEATGLVPADGDDEALGLPDTALSPAWAGVAPPRSGWSALGALPAAHLQAVAAHGIEQVAATVPTDAGEDIVRTVRARVWGALDDTLHDAPRGVAFAADALGFLVDPEEPVAVFRAERWTRFSFRRGHVLSRGPARTGLTEIRTTGRAEA